VNRTAQIMNKNKVPALRSKAGQYGSKVEVRCIAIVYGS
jgi:hypothetical protein